MKEKHRDHSNGEQPADDQGCVALVCSEDRNFLEHYRELFGRLGFIPATVTTSEAALTILQMTAVAFVVLDHGSKNLENRRVLQRARESQQHAPTLVITRKPDQDVRHEALAMGATACLIHPVLPDDIVHAILTNDIRMRQSANRPC